MSALPPPLAEGFLRLPLQSWAQLNTDRADAYLFKLAKHFAKKVPVQLSDELAQVEFAFGQCELRSPPGAQVLRIHCACAHAQAQTTMHAVLASHLALLNRQVPVELFWENLPC
ncbi:hypothetical protein HNP55_003778 [Paucibacter oligotrophus]|uniref:DUF2218 domain-containing protein n=1 Tax=Roseateles oligotrophus TaxID=1769250 RepID=A0A840LBX2_9BURK|nr:DUF2218 domain-containing protein [Roseateles oligotrophus]MBB4845231.1 hypothetical protein [Roseateles oligotrophus]